MRGKLGPFPKDPMFEVPVRANMTCQGCRRKGLPGLCSRTPARARPKLALSFLTAGSASFPAWAKSAPSLKTTSNNEPNTRCKSFLLSL